MQGPGTRLSPQIGTEAMLKVSVPQTGNAVPGFWPSVLQTVCADREVVHKAIITSSPIKILFIIRSGKVITMTFAG